MGNDNISDSNIVDIVNNMLNSNNDKYPSFITNILAGIDSNILPPDDTVNITP
jgi:hypothetical protein